MPSQKQTARKDSRSPSGSDRTEAPRLSGVESIPSTGGRQASNPALMAESLRKKVQQGAEVLVVDDEVVVRRVVTDYLEGKGYAVTSVDSGEAALEWLKQNSPGIILLDIFMPGVNGLEVLREVKHGRPGVDVLVISGFADAELERKVRALGAIDCLRKPFDFNALLSIVSSRINPSCR